MEEEYVSHVDENDKVIGKVSRSKMRKHNLCHRGTAIFIFNSKGEILIHKRTSTKNKFPSYLDMLNGGVVSHGESYDENAIRELEELNELIKKEKFTPDGVEIFNRCLEESN